VVTTDEFRMSECVVAEHIHTCSIKFRNYQKVFTSISPQLMLFVNYSRCLKTRHLETS